MGASGQLSLCSTVLVRTRVGKAGWVRAARSVTAPRNPACTLDRVWYIYRHPTLDRVWYIYVHPRPAKTISSFVISRIEPGVCGLGFASNDVSSPTTPSLPHLTMNEIVGFRESPVFRAPVTPIPCCWEPCAANFTLPTRIGYCRI